MADPDKKSCTPCKHGHRPTKPLTDLTMVTISIGEDFGEKQDYILPMEYLTSVSPYFENAFKGSFREAVEKKISLANVEVETFGIYVEWLNSHKIVDENGEAFAGENAIEISRHAVLLKLYLFADEYDHPQLRRDVLEVFIRHTNKYTHCVGVETTSKAYDRLPANSPLLRFLVDHYACEWSPASTATETFPPIQFLYMLAIKLRAQADCLQLPRRVQSPYLNDCDYHEHDAEKEAEG
ncbi:hypothetical protein BLS_005464 [Venturia inaequalis]|uniref:BTB domain-containing protein n=1 Tax=Venturia inaequalis TaxID=5025 RepID=A0A8H3YZF9_VENIN|nr:hypothetical protein BLS_005464 [Venturia inaequalis]KAE9977603.1 hypothetical protein EG328_001976 [Venturia inaequalis]